MNGVLVLLEANRFLVQFLYGQAFFVAALAIALRHNRQSSFRLAKVIWLFAAFTILHALSEWGEVFLPLQRSYLPAAVVRVLQVLQLLLVGVSFVLLYQFGASLLAQLRPRWAWAQVLTVPLGVAWSASLLFGPVLFPAFMTDFFELALAGARILLLVPATGLTVAALVLEAGDAELAALPRISNWVRWAAVSLLGWASVAEIVPSLIALAGRAALPMLETPLVTAAIPAGLGLAYCITRAMEIFGIEQRRQIEAMERRHLVLLERERIGQELHDGVTQILYTIGMRAQAGLLQTEHERTRELLGSVSDLAKTGLDEVRSAVDASLPRLSEGQTIDAAIRALPREYAPLNGPALELCLDGERRPLALAIESTLYRIAREAFFNACRHGGASHIRVTLTFQPDQVGIRIEDNGLGIVDEQRVAALQGAGGRRGLAGLVERLTPWHGTLGIQRRRQGGTEVVATIPLSPYPEPAPDARETA